MSESIPQVRYACPECKGDVMDVQIITWALLEQEDEDGGFSTITDEAQFQDHEWDENSLMQCRGCGYCAKAIAFHAKEATTR